MFSKQAGLEAHRYCTILYLKDTLRIAFQFHNCRTERNAYSVFKDGGSKKRTTHGRFIRCLRLLRSNPDLIALSKLKGTDNSYSPAFDDEVSAWVINIAPGFELDFSKVRPADGGLGIYRYLDKGVIVYIGQGIITQRVAEPERKVWTYDKIEYSLIDDEKLRLYWENKNLNDFENQFGRLPRYNAIRGQNITL